MAFPSSGIFAATMTDVFDTSQAALDLDLETHQVALYTDSVTGANLDTDTAYGVGAWASNEVPNGTGYTTGGELLTGTTFTAATGVTTWDATDTPWTSSTFSSVRGCLIYAAALASPVADAGIIALNFGSDYGVTSGTFTVQWHTSGILTVNWTP